MPAWSVASYVPIDRTARCLLPFGTGNVSAASVPVVLDGSRVAAPVSLGADLEWLLKVREARCALLDSWSNFTDVKRTQHIGLLVQRTVSEHLVNLDAVRENHVLAVPKGTLTMQGSRLRFVPQVLVGGESPVDSLDDGTGDESDACENTLLFAGVRSTYDAHVREQLRLAEVLVGPQEAWEDMELAVLSEDGYFDRLRLLRHLAGTQRLLVAGGRARMEVWCYPRLTKEGAVMLDANGKPRIVRDGRPEKVEVHSNELPASSRLVSEATAVRGVRTVRTELVGVMRQEGGEPNRVAPDDDSYHAGSGIAKVRTHTPAALERDEATGRFVQEVAEQLEHGDRAWFELLAMWDQLVPQVDAWFRLASRDQDVVWECRNAWDAEPIFGCREDPSPYVDERGSDDGVWVSSADEAEEAHIVW